MDSHPHGSQLLDGRANVERISSKTIELGDDESVALLDAVQRRANSGSPAAAVEPEMVSETIRLGST
jgi:hypothetical protein